jgi:hypothetical protein
MNIVLVRGAECSQLDSIVHFGVLVTRCLESVHKQSDRVAHPESLVSNVKGFDSFARNAGRFPNSVAWAAS